MTLTDAEWAETDAIQGWLSRPEADLLNDLGGTPWCEIGAWRGRSTSVLVRTGAGYTIDTFNGSPTHVLEQDARGVYEDWVRNAGRTGAVTVLRGDYAERVHHVPGNLRLLFIDHDHRYRPTREAFELYAPKVRPGGHVVLHDAVWEPHEAPGGNPWPEVTRFTDEIAAPWDRLPDVARCAVFKRR